MAKLRRTRQAEIDLVEIWTFIAEENAIAADKLIRDLDVRSHQLLTHPKMGVVKWSWKFGQSVKVYS